MQFSGLSLSLPKNIHLLTFEPWKSDSILVRFEHILQKNEDVQYSQAVTFNFRDVFRSYDVVSIRETTLSANQWLNEAKRFDFNIKTEDSNEITPSTAEDFTTKTPRLKKAQPIIQIRPDVSSRHYHKRANTFRQHRAAEDDENAFKITLKPMEIRTYVVKLEHKP